MLACILSILCIPTTALHNNFITRKNDKLFDGQREFRFISFNVPNLHLLEDNFAFEDTNNWALPTSFEIRDALTAVKEAGGLVVRQYCFRIQKSNEPTVPPKHVTALRTYDETAFRVLDTVLAVANELGVRVIIPFLEGPPWWGPKRHFARLRGRGYSFNSREVREDYKHLVNYVVNRQNTCTGKLYKDDKVILCWETGNEMRTSGSWLSEMAAYIKSVDPNHLVMDGNYGVRNAAIHDHNIDIVTNHFYRKSPGAIDRDMRKCRGKKVYIVGEWGGGIEAAKELVGRIMQSGAAGALIWSLRYRYRDGGFTWHKGEGLHWPGGFNRVEQADEVLVLPYIRRMAFAIRDTSPLPLQPPAPPLLLPIEHPSAISWQGSVGAVFYSVERADSLHGPWQVIGDSVSETAVAYQTLFQDTLAAMHGAYYYRILAHSKDTVSRPSNVVGPVSVHTLRIVDELFEKDKRFEEVKGVRFTDKRSWRYKYDFHRYTGGRGGYLKYAVKGPISAIRLYSFYRKYRKAFMVEVSPDDCTYTSIPLTKNTVSVLL